MRKWIVFAALVLNAPAMPAQAFTLEQLDQLKKEAETRARNARDADLDSPGMGDATNQPAPPPSQALPCTNAPGVGALTGEGRPRCPDSVP